MHNNEIKRYFSRFLTFVGGVLPILFWLLLIYGFDEPCVAGVTVIAAIIHEAGHEGYVFFKCGLPYSVRGALSGFRIRRKEHFSYCEEIKLYFAGPFANFAAALTSLPFLCISRDYIGLFALINIATAVSNLLPVKGHDGYGIVKTYLEMKETPEIYFSILMAFSFVFVILLCFFSLYLMDRCDGGYWIYGIFIISLISEISNMLKSTKSEYR